MHPSAGANFIVVSYEIGSCTKFFVYGFETALRTRRFLFLKIREYFLSCSVYPRGAADFFAVFI
jgi:hypothetical protein